MLPVKCNRPSNCTAEGKLGGWCEGCKNLFNIKGEVMPKSKNNFDYFWEMLKIHKPESEFKFHPDRKWRFDFAWPHWMIAIEVEGGIWVGGGHTRGVIYQQNIEKYNWAKYLGWDVYRFTPGQFKNGEAFDFLNMVFMRAKGIQISYEP